MDQDNTMSGLDTQELHALRQRVAEMERQVSDLQQKTVQQEVLLHSIPALVYYKDRGHTYRFANQAFADSVAMSLDTIVGKTDFDLFPADIAEAYVEDDEEVMRSGQPRLNVELPINRVDGTRGWVAAWNIPYRDPAGDVIGMVGIAIDITERKRMEEELGQNATSLRELTGEQERLLETVRELSTPVLSVYERVLVLPLIGHIDSARSQQIMEALLDEVQRRQAQMIIIDVTGVPIVDTAIANHLIQTTRAVGLLGAQCILVGIAPEVAQTLVQLGIDLSALATRSDLEAGIAYALARRGLAITPQPSGRASG